MTTQKSYVRFSREQKKTTGVHFASITSECPSTVLQLQAATFQVSDCFCQIPLTTPEGGKSARYSNLQGVYGVCGTWNERSNHGKADCLNCRRISWKFRGRYGFLSRAQIPQRDIYNDQRGMKAIALRGRSTNLSLVDSLRAEAYTKTAVRRDRQGRTISK
jgi:hypothetical protein